MSKEILNDYELAEQRVGEITEKFNGKLYAFKDKEDVDYIGDLGFRKGGLITHIAEDKVWGEQITGLKEFIVESVDIKGKFRREWRGESEVDIVEIEKDDYFEMLWEYICLASYY